MKIKGDFVTNSSSSSFVVMGLYFDYEKIPKEEWHRIIEKVSDGGELTMEDIFDNFSWYIDKILKGTDLQYSGGCEYSYDSSMIGIPYTQMKDDETLAEFKTRVKEQIKDAFGFITEVCHIEQCWINN